MDNETVVDIAVVSKVEGSALKEIVVELVPGVLNEGEPQVRVA